MVARDERGGPHGRDVCVTVRGDTKGPVGMTVALPTSLAQLRCGLQ